MNKTVKYIQTIQTLLTEAGYYHGAIDGQLGPLSIEAVKQSIADRARNPLDKPKVKTKSKYRLSNASLRKLKGVHPDLVKVVKRAIEITGIDFKVGEGVRTLAKQRQYVNSGASKTMRSRHLTGHAVDLWAIDPDTGKVSWHWPLYGIIEKAMKQAARELGITIEWGGDWRSFKDGPHYQLPWGKYPK